jgi:ion channel POLLUX/CASTOR
VAERDHTVILGWSPQIFTVLSELIRANENQRRACIAVLADE